MRFPERGLYAITQSDGQAADVLAAQVAAALRGGARALQYRDKQAQNPLQTARQLLALCETWGVPLLINDDPQLALQVGAHGVHLGKDDGDIAAARLLLGAQAIIGVSCYDSLQRAVDAVAAGADYVAFGRFFPSQSKPLAAPAQLGTLTLAKQTLQVPIVAIGGILPENAAQLLQAGADVLAVIGGVFADPDPESAARRLQGLF